MEERGLSFSERRLHGKRQSMPGIRGMPLVIALLSILSGCATKGPPQSPAVGGAEEAVRSAGLVVVTTPWPEFATLAPDWLRRGDGPRVGVLDCWRVLPAALAGVAEIIRFGRGPGL